MKKTTIVLSVLLALNIAATAVLGIKVCELSPGDGSVQYTLMIGMNDRDKYEQLISTDEAISRIESVCGKYVEAYTIRPAQGVWTDENGITTRESSLQCIFDNAGEEDIYRIADELLKELNQETILIESDRICVDFYKGK